MFQLNIQGGKSLCRNGWYIGPESRVCPQPLLSPCADGPKKDCHLLRDSLNLARTLKMSHSSP